MSFVGADRTVLKSTASSYRASQVCTVSLNALSFKDCLNKANKVNPPIGSTLLVGRIGSSQYGVSPNTPAMCCGFREMYRSEALPVKCRSQDRTADGDYIGIIDNLVANYQLQSPTITNDIRPITVDRANQIFEDACYDWTAKQQDTLHEGTKLLCPRVPDSFPYSSPASRFEQMTDYMSVAGNPITVECCAYGTGQYCPATGCWESPFCSELLFTHCSGINHNEQVCQDWRNFSTTKSSAHLDGAIPNTADYYGKSVVEYCRNIPNRECDAINAIQGLVFDRLVPQLSTNFIRPISTNSVEITVMNTSGRYVTASVVQRVRNTLFLATPTLTFDPFGTAVLTISVGRGDSFLTEYSFTSNTVWTQSTVNSDPQNKCENIRNPPLNRDTHDVYPVPSFCYDGDAQTNIQYSDTFSTEGSHGFDEAECTRSYNDFAGEYGCATCFNSWPVNQWDGECYGPVALSRVACNDNGPQYMCPFCFAPDDVAGQAKINTQLALTPGGDVYRNNPDPKYGGCACKLGATDKVVKCRGDTRGTCSPTSISKYFLSTTRTCVGSNAVSEFIFTNRSDLTANDFPIMGGVVVALAPSGFSMATQSLQVFPLQEVP